jgi:hypothetical protein
MNHHSFIYVEIFDIVYCRGTTHYVSKDSLVKISHHPLIVDTNLCGQNYGV